MRRLSDDFDQVSASGEIGRTGPIVCRLEGGTILLLMLLLEVTE